MVHYFGEFLKTWSLRSNSVTRQFSFNRTKIGGKCQNSTFFLSFANLSKIRQIQEKYIPKFSTWSLSECRSERSRKEQSDVKLNLVRHGKEEEEKSRALTAATKELFIHASTLKSKVLFDLKKPIALLVHLWRWKLLASLRPKLIHNGWKSQKKSHFTTLRAKRAP